MNELLQATPSGLYCAQGDFYIDPFRPVAKAVVSHAHSDHARSGCQKYLAARAGEHLLRMRLQDDAELHFEDYGQAVSIGGVQVSFHPAGHILGSAQIRLEAKGRVEVVTGDYKFGDDPTCEAWEPLACHRLITESTFGLPVYRWPDSASTMNSICDWWRNCAEEGRCSVLLAYAVGKSQRLLAGLDPGIGPIFTHGAVEKACEAYRLSGIELPPTTYVGNVPSKKDWRGAMVLAVPSAHGSAWLRKFGPVRTAMASGWMMIRGTRRRRSIDRGFVISDHVDWPSLMEAVRLCQPESVWVTHGYSAVVARFLREQGLDARAIDQRTRQEEE